MKIQIASDLHLEFHQQRHPNIRIVTPAPDADVLVLAGDIANGTDVFKMFKDWPVPVLYVAGNHEFYSHDIFAIEDKLAAMPQTDAGVVHYLENREFRLGDVRFLGATIWTDYALDGPDNMEAAMFEARRFMNDHSVIRTGRHRFSPGDAAAKHHQSRKWLKAKLDEPFEGKTVVITHHCPHPFSIAEQFKDSSVNAAFVSDLTELMGKAPLWIHGHTHASFDYSVNGTRVICNPAGYPMRTLKATKPEQILFENPEFNATLVVEI